MLLKDPMAAWGLQHWFMGHGDLKVPGLGFLGCESAPFLFKCQETHSCQGCAEDGENQG